MRKILLAALFAACCASGALAQNFDSLGSAAPAPQAAPDPAPAAPAGCVDDPRLETDLITIMDSSDPVTPPITITAETYLVTEPDVLKRLAGQMVICPNIPVMKSGKAARKIPIEFEALWKAMRDAAVAGDKTRIKQLAESFVAKPKSTKDIAKLVTELGVDKNTQEIMNNALKLDEYPGSFLLFDLYKALGGSSTDTIPVFISHLSLNQREKAALDDKYEEWVFIQSHSPKKYKDMLNVVDE